MSEKCNCRKCLKARNEEYRPGLPIYFERMIVCKKCGNKRCPHANDCGNKCTGSNEPGQPKSYYT